jgi:hypothetical protein
MVPPGLKSRLDNLQKTSSFLKGKRSAAVSRVSSLEGEISDLEIRVFKLEKVTLVMAQLIEKQVKKDLCAIDNLVNYGLKIVFPDRDLQFKSDMVMVGGKMQVDFTTLDTGMEISTDAFGSVSVIESLLLRIICIMKTKTGKLLLLDETFGALDNDYVLQLGSLLKTLAEKTKMDILLVTFNGFLSDADTLLRARLNHKTRELSITDGRTHEAAL